MSNINAVDRTPLPPEYHLSSCFCLVFRFMMHCFMMHCTHNQMYNQLSTIRTPSASSLRQLRSQFFSLRPSAGSAHRSEQGDPTHDDSGRHTPGLTTTVTHRNGLFRLGVILGRIARHAETRRVEIGGFPYSRGGLGGFPRLGHA
jgi:hypothetical protein